MMKVPRQLTSLYHIFHYVVLSFFFLILYPSVLRPNAKANLNRTYLFDGGLFLHFGMEVDIMVGMALVLFYQLQNYAQTLDEGLHRFLLNGKILSLILSFLAVEYYTMMGLIVTYAIMAIMLEPPRYDGPSRVVTLTKTMFTDKVMRDYYDKDNKPYLVMFQNRWDINCRLFEQQFCELSVTYPDINFGSLEVADCHDIVGALLIEDENGEPQQLPVLVLFHGGNEIRRIPQVDDMGKVIKSVINKKIVTQHFELDVEPSKVTYRKTSKKNKGT
jgi:hypothetical protein